MLGNLDYLIGIEIETRYSIVALGFLGFLLNAEAVAMIVEFGHAVAFRIGHPVAENGGLVMLLHISYGISQQSRKTCTEEDIVAQHEAGTVVADELFTDDKGLRKSIW